MKTKSTKIKLLIALISAVCIYLLICTGCYFFEKPYYGAPSLNDYNHYFDSYSKYSQSNSSDLFIRQITSDDVCTADDARLKYVDDTVLVIIEDNYSYSDVTTLSEEYNFEITGMIPDVNFYQFTFSNDLSIDQLKAICNNLKENDIIKLAIPDYFEESPTEINTEIDYVDNSDIYELLELDYAWEKFSNTTPVNLGLIDFYVDSTNNYINIANTEEFSSESLYGDYYDRDYYGSASHGTHVAGIMSAKPSSSMRGVLSNAPVYSYNGINVSTSYWFANIYDMIVNNNVKAINISMGYNPYIIMSAALGCENAIEFTQSEQEFMSEFLANIIDNGYEFVICAAAGNDNNNTAYRTFGGYFKYGDKKILSKLDIFGIFDSKPEYVDAKYSYFFSSPTIKSVADRVIIVGSVSESGIYSIFSNSGEVDIAAPGESVYSTVLENEFEISYGTSMAAPFVTGAAGMLFSLNPDLTGIEVKEILINSSTTETHADGFTYPVLNIGNAVRTIIE